MRLAAIHLAPFLLAVDFGLALPHTHPDGCAAQPAPSYIGRHNATNGTLPGQVTFPCVEKPQQNNTNYTTSPVPTPRPTQTPVTFADPPADDPPRGKDHLECVPQPQGQGPRPQQDTADAFRRFSSFLEIANNAAVPKGYEEVARGLEGSAEYIYKYLGTETLEEYDTAKCASACNDLPTCSSFNIYFERDPLYDPNAERGCPNPDSTTMIKCVLWQEPMGTTIELNRGQHRVDFEVAIAGSNFYNRKDPNRDIPGFDGPRENADNHAAFKVPNEPIGNYSTAISHDVLHYNGSFTEYDVNVCASICNGWTETHSMASKSGSGSGPFKNKAFAVCSMFVAYELRRGGKPVSMVCDTYSSVWSGHYQTVREVDQMFPIKVSVYQRHDYQYKAICAMEAHCKGDEFYAGGDCSG